MLSNRLLSALPIPWTAAIIPRAIAATISAYSTRSCPSVSFQKRIQRFFIFFLFRLLRFLRLSERIRASSGGQWRRMFRGSTLAEPLLHELEIRERRRKVRPYGEGLEQFAAAPLVFAVFH